MATTECATELAPFLGSVQNVFGVMLQTEVEQIAVEKLEAGSTDLVSSSAVIGLKGTDSWTLTLVIPAETGKRITQRFLQTEEDLPEGDISDALGELANMVAGGAKAQLSSERNENISITLPTVVTGSNYKLDHPAACKEAKIRYVSDLGDFAMDVIYCHKGS